jgi:hypothetical protein
MTSLKDNTTLNELKGRLDTAAAETAAARLRSERSKKAAETTKLRKDARARFRPTPAPVYRNTTASSVTPLRVK